MAEDIKVTFVIQKDCLDENYCSEEMQLAFIACEQHRGGGLQPRWIKETELTQLEGLTKKDVYVLNEFAGEIFEKLRETKCLLVGPRCLSCCLTEGTPIPSGPEPVYTVAMRGLSVSASGMTKQQKESIRRKVHWMGGTYSAMLTCHTTHLVSDTVLSDKYIISVEKGIPIMKESWIEAVWDASLRLNVNGASPDFLGHRLPPFYNLQVTTSGISKKDKQMIMKLVKEFGGQFSGAFQSELTDVVILNKDGVGSEKYKAALEYGKACVSPAWARESAGRGVALPLARYRVAGAASTSSPLAGADHRLPDMSLDFSRITNARAPSNFVDESRSVDVSTMSGRLKLSQERKSMEAVDADISAAFDNLDMSSIKKAGPIFDGFCIWVAGPEGAWRERACAVVSRCGGVRSDAAATRVTHAVCGSRAAAALAGKQLPAAPVLSALWLVRSVERGEAAGEAEFLMDVNPGSLTPKSERKRAPPPPSSPMSARNLQLLRRGPLSLAPPEPAAAAPDHPEVDGGAPDAALSHYLSQNLPPEPTKETATEPPAQDVTSGAQPDLTDDLDEPTEEVEQIFRGVRIEVHGLDAEATCSVAAEVSAAGGCLVSAAGTHALVPLDVDPAEVPTRAVKLTVFWLKDCLSQQELVPIQYYHRPVRIAPWAGDSAAPLRGVVLSLSTYSGVERAFLDELAKLLGATTQLRFCRRTTATALASTHLLCPTASGDKYSGAVKWGLPAVRGEWLLRCADTGRRAHEGPYLVGETKAPTSPIQEEDPQPDIPEQETTKEDQSTTKKDKENEMLPPAKGAVPRHSREGTPKAKEVANDAESDLSPASRYIAMARQGLLGGDSQETPKRVGEIMGDAKQGGEVRTPSLEDALSTPNLRGLSPTTRRRLQAVKRGEMPSDPIRTPTDPFEKAVPTPDSAFGAALRPGSSRLSPDARKRLWQVVQQLPSKEPQPPTKHNQTPLSEIRNRFLAQFNADAPTPPSDQQPHAQPRKLHLQEQADTPPAKVAKLSVNQSPGGSASSAARPPPPPPPEPIINSASSPAPALPAIVDAQLDRLSAALSGLDRSPAQRLRRASVANVKPPQFPAPESEPGPESQPNTVGWDDTTPAAAAPGATPDHKRFMLSSNVDNREELIAMIAQLGGSVSEGGELDDAATHLLCCAPGRSEKMLGSVAHGKWVLHPAYVARSRESGRFLDEQEYEWGNPLATTLPLLPAPAERALAAAAHRWRVARARGLPGAFRGLRALLHVPPARRRLLRRLLHAGGGEAPDLEPPYNDESITVCFADVKRYPLSERDAAWLKARRVPVCAPVVLSSYLTEESRPDAEQLCLPEFRP